MDVVSGLHQVLANIKALDLGRIARDAEESKQYKLLIKRGTCFVPYFTPDGLAFAPSRFVGYVGNSLLAHMYNDGRDGRKTNIALIQIFGAEPLPNANLEARYLKFCAEVGVEPSKTGTFGVLRKYWLTPDAESFLAGDKMKQDHEFSDSALDIQEDAYSWSVLSSNEAIKRVDKSAILHHGTGVPKQVLPYFGINDANPPKSLRAVHRGKELDLRVSVDPLQRVRLFWPKGLSVDIARAFPAETAMLKAGEEQGRGAIIMHFLKINNSSFEIEMYGAGSVAEETVPEEYMAHVEGKAVKVEYSRRMRSAINRQKAIEIHGSTCAVCGFDFEKTYGHLGRGFIEVHHLNPLGESEEEAAVNPATDLIPLCANCHRMAHRGKDGVLSLNELRLALTGKMA